MLFKEYPLPLQYVQTILIHVPTKLNVEIYQSVVNNQENWESYLITKVM